MCVRRDLNAKDAKENHAKGSKGFFIATLCDSRIAVDPIRADFNTSNSKDIDILFYGEAVIVSYDLVVPHPRIGERRFVLEPLAEIGGEVVHPVVKMKVREMLEGCEDELRVVKIMG